MLPKRHVPGSWSHSELHREYEEGFQALHMGAVFAQDLQQRYGFNPQLLGSVRLPVRGWR